VGWVRSKGNFMASILSQVQQVQTLTQQPDRDTPVVVGFDRKLDLVTPLMVHSSFGSLVSELFGEAWQTAPSRAQALLFDDTGEELDEAGRGKHCDELLKISKFDSIWIQLENAKFGTELYKAADVIPLEHAYRQLNELQEKAETTRDIADIQAAKNAFSECEQLSTPVNKTWMLLYRQLGKCIKWGNGQLLGHWKLKNQEELNRWIFEQVCARRVYDQSPEQAVECVLEMIEIGLPLQIVLRVVLLFDLTSSSSVTHQHMRKVKEAIKLKHGREALYTLLALQDGLELLQAREHPATFCTMVRRYKLFGETYNGEQAEYVPLCVRLLQLVVTSDQSHSQGSHSIERWSQPKVKQALHSAELPGRIVTRGSAPFNPSAPVILIFPGGCTQEEIYQAQGLARNKQRKITIITSKVLNGEDVIDAYKVKTV